MSNSKLFNSVILSCFFIAFASCTSPYFSTTRKCSAQQARALLLFKESLFSINDTSSHTICEDTFSEIFPKLMNWNINSDCCNWDGVTCKGTTGDVIGLNLRCGMLQGTIHANSTLFNLPRLETLDMTFNNLTLEPRALITLFQNCTNLKELSLRRVNISSGLPSNLNISSSLKKINLRSTMMHGKLPHNLFNLLSLEELDLSNKNFTGQIPSEISHLPKLSLLDLSNNIGIDLPPYILNNLLLNSTLLVDLWLADINIGLVLPTYLNISSLLKSLDLTSTGLQGKVPDNIFNLKYLEELILSGNSNLTGPMPIVNTSTSIDLNYLDLSFTNLSGELPYSIGHLKSLNYLSFSNCGLMGPLPESLVNLRQLVFLYLSSNKLSGELPTWLFTLPSLEYVRLSRNNLKGTIPLELFSLQSIKGLSLGYNQLSGKLDVLGNAPVAQTFQKLTNLTYLDLSNNNFRGDWELDTLLSSLTNLRELHLSRSGLSVMTKNATSYVNPDFKLLGLAYCKIKVFPKCLQAMKKLESLDISNNDIHGHIPDWVGEIGGNRLLVLDLSNNSIAGTIPNVYEDFGSLEGLILNGNQLEGKIPTSLYKCRSLKVLDLGNNNLNGTFPSWLGDLPNLKALILKSNNFHGYIFNSSDVEFPFPSLRVFDLSNNGFEGRLPANYFLNFNAMKNVVKKGTKPEYLYMGGQYYSIVIAVKGVDLEFPRLLVEYTIVDLSSNKFENEIPNIIGNLRSLKVLDLSHNKLIGSIPNSFGKLSEIESLDLSCNQLTGEIPPRLVDLTFISFLNISQNHLVGRIPKGKQFNTFEGNSFGGNPELCGLPLLKKCEYPRKPEIEGVDEDKENIGFTWKPVMLGYSCGTLLGLGLGYLMLSTGRPKWFNALVDAAQHRILKMQT